MHISTALKSRQCFSHFRPFLPLRSKVGNVFEPLKMSQLSFNVYLQSLRLRCVCEREWRREREWEREQWVHSRVARQETKVKIGELVALAGAACLGSHKLDWLIDWLIDYWRAWLMPHAFVLIDSMRESVERAELCALWATLLFMLVETRVVGGG